jgi:hypothetical protein
MKSLAPILLLLCTACVTRAPRQEVPASMPSAGAPVLYGRDGTPVWNAGTGETLTRNGPAGEAKSAEGSRVYMLELYQRVIDEKEKLQLEVQSLQASLDRSQADLHAAQNKHAEASKEVSRLQAELEQSRAESLELAGRLVTAQIRRLEAEKLLLEHRIEAARQAAQAHPEDAGKAPAKAEKP